MKKDATRDYITQAFRSYAAMGCPTYKTYRQELYDAHLRYAENDPANAVQFAEAAVRRETPLLLDILAVEKTIELLERGEKAYILQALRAVYFAAPNSPLRKADVSRRVTWTAQAIPASERTVYYWLKQARMLCAALRGLTIRQEDIQRYHLANIQSLQ